MRNLAFLALAALLPAACAPATPPSGSQPVSIRFAAMVGDEPFACGRTYQGLGARASRATPSDFRFYVSRVELLDEAGQAVPVALEQDGVWQHADVALLDFEDRSGPCLTGTAQTNETLRGNVPPGRYRGLRFTLGVPFALNHADATVAPSPLNLSSMFWNWQGGYKFLRADLATAGRPQALRPGMALRAGDMQASHSLGFAIHIGSTQCAAAGPAQPPATPCRNPNRVTVELPGFDPATGVVVADLKALLEGVDLEVNQPGTSAGCMATPTDGDCDPLMRNLGLPFAGRPSDGQRFFHAR